MLIDTHAHLYWDSFQEDFDEMIQRALAAGVSTIINVGVDVEKSKEALEQAKSLETIKALNVYSSIGIHPEESIKYFSDLSADRHVSIHKDIIALEKLYQSAHDQIVAIGECGLDFLPDWVSSPEVKDLQRKLFQAQIDLAKKLNLPLLVHCRDDRSKNPENSAAWDETIKMISSHPAILHCYSGLSSTTDLVIKSSNLIISFAGNLTYPKNEYLREAAKIIPLDRIVLETDCPFLPPQNKRGQRNEPSFIVETAQTLADIKNLPLDEVTKLTSSNVAKLLSLR